MKVKVPQIIFRRPSRCTFNCSIRSFSKTYSSKQELELILKRVETDLQQSSIDFNSNRMLLSLKRVHDLNIEIPYCYLEETAAVLAKKHDIEISLTILRICRKNSAKSRIDDKRHYLQNKLSAFMVTNMIRNGSLENAVNIWQRIAGSWHDCDKYLIPKVLDSLSLGNRVLKIEFLSQIYDAMKAGLYHQLPKHNIDTVLVLLGFLNNIFHTYLKNGSFRDGISDVDLGVSLRLLHSVTKNVDILNNSDLNVATILQAAKISTLVVIARLGSEFPIYASIAHREISVTSEDFVSQVSYLNQQKRKQIVPDEKNSSAIIDAESFLSLLSNENILMPSIKDKISPEIEFAILYPFICQKKSSAFGINVSIFIQRAVNDLLSYISDNGHLDEVVKLLRVLISAREANFPLTAAQGIDYDSLICKTMKSARFFLDNLDSKDLEQSVYKKLVTFADSLPVVSSGYEHMFQAAKVATFFKNISFLSSSPCLQFSFEDKKLEKQNFVGKGDILLRFVSLILGTSEHDFKCICYTSPIIFHAVVKGLCGLGDYNAIETAHSMIRIAETGKLDVRPNTYLVLLRGATSLCHDDSLMRIISLVENKITGVSSPHRAVYDRLLLPELLLSNSRLSRGMKALEILETLHLKGILVNKTSYVWVINSFVHLSPSSTEEWSIFLGPQNLVDRILIDMRLSNVNLDFSIMMSFLKLFCKSCLLSRFRNTGQKETVNMMKKFIDQIISRDYLGHPQIKNCEEYLAQLAKGMCQAGFVDMALDFVGKMGNIYNIKATSITYEPIIYHYSVVRGSLRASEDVCFSMLNRMITPSTNIINSLLLGILKYNGDEAEAIDRAQDFFNQHRIYPSPLVILKILDQSLKRGDVHEARRAVVVIRQIYSTSIKTKTKEASDFHFYTRSSSEKLSLSLLTKDALSERFNLFGLELDEK